MKRVRSTKKDVHSESQPNQLPPADNYLVDDSKNPMLNEVILSHLFEVIPFNCRDFKNFRQVSKLWLKTSLGRWRQEAWLHVRDEPRLVDNTCISYKPYLEMLSLRGDPYQLLGKYAFQKYKLSSPPFAICEIFSEEALLEFWNKVGPSLTHLKITEANVGLPNRFMRILIEMTPKIKFLSLDQCSGPISSGGEQPYPYTRDEVMGVNVPAWNKRLQPKPSEVRSNLTHFEITVRGNFGISWVYFFLRFPNIQTVKLQVLPLPRYGNRMRVRMWYDDNPNDEQLRIFESFQIVRANGAQNTLSNLQTLDLLNLQRGAVDLFRLDIKDLLSELAFPLSSLSIDIGFKQDEAGFKRILELYSLTLKKLLVYRGPYAEPFTQNFPYGVALPNLEELRFIGPICGNLDFLKNTPSLRTVVLLDGQTPMEPAVLHSYVDFSLVHLSDKDIGWKFHNKVDIISNTNFARRSLKNLVLPQMEEFIVGHELCGGAQVKGLAKLMPGLKKLRIGLGNEGFGAACKSWNELRHLDIEPFDVEEEGILGMKDGKKYSLPNITDLKYLTSLRMGAHSSDSMKGRLTNGSIVDGLLVAESLRSVSFRRNPVAAPKVRQLLASKFPEL